MVKVTLRSFVTSMSVLSTPSMIDWAGCAYRTAKKKAEKAEFVRIISEGYFLPPEVVIDLLREKIKWSREGTDVVFYCEQARLWKPAEGSPHQFEIQSAEWLPLPE
jgi:hypothetical protein